ncbi:Transcription factor WhiB [Actinopolymorpha cephalotaxi]|uniref:Transcription factor WhiB n=1 Tax=Actinopolymorpha cephalotaxi TaxID=504797 RepID=A0A1I2SLD2_9ACTN|nr:WhiB family transcriptional regulator [Actinopolymorpha cephalotaxi]NYH84018.1 hypothetical protein [Actinopolymorpha cephalotaxi]SFG53560.1 Transcription factor WhiB [Actinopolymorpha cephalotaxi]
MTTTDMVTALDTPVEWLPLRVLEEHTATDGLCRQPEANPDAWYPERQAPDFLAAEADRLCGPCPVRAACLELAVRHEARGLDAWGIWGGTTPDQRRPLVQTRLRADAPHAGASTPESSRAGEVPPTSQPGTHHRRRPGGGRRRAGEAA